MQTKSNRSLCLAALVTALSVLSACTSCVPTQWKRSVPGPVNHKYTADVGQMAQSVIVMYSVTGDDQQFAGAGVVVKCKAGEPVRVISAWHVLKEITEVPPVGVPFMGDGTRVMPLRIVKKDTANDVVILEGIAPEKASCPHVRLAKELPEIGSPVWVVGHPLGHRRNVSHGVLSYVALQSLGSILPYGSVDPEKTVVYRTDAASVAGNSGGGLFNSRGELIGISSFIEAWGAGPLAGYPAAGGTYAVGLPHLWILTMGLD